MILWYLCYNGLITYYTRIISPTGRARYLLLTFDLEFESEDNFVGLMSPIGGNFIQPVSVEEVFNN